MTTSPEPAASIDSPTGGALPRFIDSAALRNLLPVGRTTFYKAIAQAEFPTAIQLIDGGDYLWELDEVLAYLETQRRHPGAAIPAHAATAARHTEEPTVGVRAARAKRRRPEIDDATAEVTFRVRRTGAEAAA